MNPVPQPRSFSSKDTTHNGNETTVPNDGQPPFNDTYMQDAIKFPNLRNPHEHPLVPLSEEEMQERQKHLQKVQVDNKPRVYQQILTPDGRAYAIGSRKRSKAKVWIGDGDGTLTVNGRPWIEYFYRIDHRDKILRPFALVGLIGKMDVTCEVRGGGSTGQAEAVRHGVARALQNWDPQFRPTLKKEGLLTRDPREVESKKYGRKKARKSFQWVKR